MAACKRPAAAAHRAASMAEDVGAEVEDESIAPSGGQGEMEGAETLHVDKTMPFAARLEAFRLKTQNIKVGKDISPYLNVFFLPDEVRNLWNKLKREIPRAPSEVQSHWTKLEDMSVRAGKTAEKRDVLALHVSKPDLWCRYLVEQTSTLDETEMAAQKGEWLHEGEMEQRFGAAATKRWLQQGLLESDVDSQTQEKVYRKRSKMDSKTVSLSKAYKASRQGDVEAADHAQIHDSLGGRFSRLAGASASSGRLGESDEQRVARLRAEDLEKKKQDREAKKAAAVAAKEAAATPATRALEDGEKMLKKTASLVTDAKTKQNLLRTNKLAAALREEYGKLVKKTEADEKALRDHVGHGAKCDVKVMKTLIGRLSEVGPAKAQLDKLARGFLAKK